MSLSMWCLCVAGVSALLGVTALAVPAALARAILALPRSVWAGRLLTLVAYAWIAGYLWTTPVDWFDFMRPYLWYIAIAACAVTIFFVEELLAIRALGGLLLMAPYFILDAARWTGTPVRFVPVVLAYLCVITGSILIAAPWWFRKALAPFVEHARWMRLLGCAALTDAALFAVVARYFQLRGF
ncbi:MAG: hypothetical protein WCL16_08710 [bacterium]